MCVSLCMSKCVCKCVQVCVRVPVCVCVCKCVSGCMILHKRMRAGLCVCLLLTPFVLSPQPLTLLSSPHASLPPLAPCPSRLS